MTAYYQMIDVAPKGRWYLKGLSDSTGTDLDPRDFCYGSRLEVSPNLRIHSKNGDMVDVKFPLHVGLRSQGHPLGFTFGSFDMPVVSEAIARLLLSISPDAIQVFPVAIDSRAESFYIVNATQSFGCIDPKRSELEWWGEADGRPDKIGKPRAVYRLLIDPGLVRGRHIFRVEGWEVALIVSDSVKKAFKDAGVTGVAFEEV